jgi:predicted RNase H-like HicB family nuclease
MTDLHIVYTETGDSYGWTIESPQIPELIGGRDTVEELVADTDEIIEWAKDSGTEFDGLFVHEQHLVVDPAGREYLIRWQFNSDDYDARYETAGRLNYAVLNGWGDDDEIAQQPVLPTGERLFIAAVGADTLGWVEDQLSECGGCCVLAEHLGDGAVANVPFGVTGQLGPRGVNIKQLGLNRESTFREMADAVISHELDKLREVHLPPDAVRGIARHMPTSPR